MKTRKIKVIGKENYINQATGEIQTFDVIEETDKDFNFQKIWLGHILEALDSIGGKKIKIINYFLDNKDSQNRVISTQRKISNDIGASLTVVNDTIKVMINHNLLKMEQQGVYMLNPNVIFKGSHKSRMNVLIKYKKAGAEQEKLNL